MHRGMEERWHSTPLALKGDLYKHWSIICVVNPLITLDVVAVHPENNKTEDVLNLKHWSSLVLLPLHLFVVCFCVCSSPKELLRSLVLYMFYKCVPACVCVTSTWEALWDRHKAQHDDSLWAVFCKWMNSLPETERNKGRERLFPLVCLCVASETHSPSFPFEYWEWEWVEKRWQHLKSSTKKMMSSGRDTINDDTPDDGDDCVYRLYI